LALLWAAGKKNMREDWRRGVLGYGDICKKKPAQYSVQVI